MQPKLVALAVAVIAVLAWASPALAQDLPPAGPQCDGSTGDWSARALLFTEGTNAPAAAVDGVCTAAASERIAVSLATTSDAFHRPDPRRLRRGRLPLQRRRRADATPSSRRSRASSPTATATSASTGRPAPRPAGRGTATSPARACQSAGTQQAMRVEVMDNAHPSTEPLANPWNRTDIWPTFSNGPRGNAHVLAQLDRVPPYTSALPALDDRPIAWCRAFDGGRSWYTGMGGTAASYADPAFRSHLGGGIAYAAGAEAGDCAATLSSSVREGPARPRADDGRADGARRAAGRARALHQPRHRRHDRHGPGAALQPVDAATRRVAATIPVDERFEDGLIGITLDPDFASNHWVFLFYSARGEPLRQRLSRFTLVGDQLDMELGEGRSSSCRPSATCAATRPARWTGTPTATCTSRSATTPTRRRLGRHGADRRAPGARPAVRRPAHVGQHQRPARQDPADQPARDAGRTPGVGTTYTVPVDNLFPESRTPRTRRARRSTSWACATRSACRSTSDTGTLYWGEVGPDAGSARSRTAARRPTTSTTAPPRPATTAGPTAAARTSPTTTGTSRTERSPARLFPCGGATGPVNDSPRNTGLQQLPPTRPSTLWEQQAGSPEWPEFGTACCSAAFGGEVYHPDDFPRQRREVPRATTRTTGSSTSGSASGSRRSRSTTAGPSTGAPLEPSPWLPGVHW